MQTLALIYGVGLGLSAAVAGAEEPAVGQDSNGGVRVVPQLELGLLWPVAHTIRSGSDGSHFDYVAEGGQGNLFSFWRAEIGVEVDDRHALLLLYQPLDLVTQPTLRRDVVFDGATFAAGTPLELRYGFTFWRASYLYRLAMPEGITLALGASLQIRNATIVFRAADGSASRANRDIGPVPLLKGQLRFPLGANGWAAAEVDGMYAPVKYINGGDSDVEGAIIDLSLRLGTRLERGLEPFVGVRWLGGGATGTSPDAESFADGYVSNWLHFVTLTVGVAAR